MSDSLRIAVICGSTRPGRVGLAVSQWVTQIANEHGEADYELLDLADFNLPVLDEPKPAAAGEYEHEHTKAWSAAVAPFDGYIMVTPEYNHSTSAALKNAIDYLYNEWLNKACGFVGYSWSGALRPVEHLRSIVANLHMVSPRGQGDVSLAHDMTDGAMTPSDMCTQNVTTMIGQLETLSRALRGVRDPATANA